MAVVTTAVVGIASAAATAIQSFEAAAAAKQAQNTADRAAKKAMAEAKQKAEKDSFAGISVPLDAYEAEFEQNLAVQQQNVEALQEGDARSLAAGVGRVGAQGQAGAEGSRIAMGEEISDLNVMKAESKDAINQQLIQMDVAHAKESNLRKRDAEAARAQAIGSGISAVGSGLTAAASLAPLYGQSKFDKRGSKLAEQYSGQKPAGMTDAQWAAKLGSKQYSKQDFNKLKNSKTANAQWNFKDEEMFFQTDAGLAYSRGDYD